MRTLAYRNLPRGAAVRWTRLIGEGSLWLLTALCFYVQAITCATAAPSSSDAWRQWVASLGAKGYVVAQGGTFILTPDACASFIETFGSCFGANPAAPYIWLKPPVNGTYIDPNYATKYTGVGPNGETTDLFYRLGDNDALITLLKLPPPAAYLGYVSYVFTRGKQYYTNAAHAQMATPSPPLQFQAPDNPVQQVSPNASRYEINGTIAPTINDLNVKNQSGAAWNGATIAYVTTSNKNLADSLITNAKASGLDAHFIFTEQIGSHIITGTGSEADDLVTLIRYAIPKDQTGAEWLKNSDANVLVYKVTNLQIPVSRFGPMAYGPKEAVDDKDLRQPLDELSRLLKNWLASKSGAPARVSELADDYRVNGRGKLSGFIGSECIALGSNCSADNQDSAVNYGALKDLAPSRIAILAGVNHTQTGAASYLSLGIGYAPKGLFDLSYQNGVAFTSQTNPAAVGFDFGNLNGSAGYALQTLGLYGFASPRLKAALPKLFVAFVSRRCEQDLPDVGKHCIDLDENAVPNDAVIGLFERNYIKPGTTTGPNGSTMLDTKVIYNY